MSFIWYTIGAILLVVWVVTIVDIIRRRLGAKRTTAWLLIVLILPFVGAILYWIRREDPPGEAERAYAAQRDLHEQQRRQW
jgi:hypothetical protein